MKYQKLSSFNKRFSQNLPTGSIQFTTRGVGQSMPSQNSYFRRQKKIWSKVLTPFLDSDDTIFKQKKKKFLQIFKNL